MRSKPEPLEMSPQAATASCSEVRPLDLAAIFQVLWMPVDGLGDIVLSLPALHCLHNALPQARIDVLVRECYGSLFRCLPFVENVIPFDPPGLPVRTRRSANLWDMGKLLAQLRLKRYDLAVDVGGKDLYRRIALFSGAQRRVGLAMSHYDRPGRRNWARTLTHPITCDCSRRHTVENSLRLLQDVGIRCGDIQFFPACSGHLERAGVAAKIDSLGIRGKYVILHGASAVKKKQWSPRNLAAVADHIIENYGYGVILTGIKKDHYYNSLVLRNIQAQGTTSDVAGLFDLSELPWLYQGAELMVTIDTGPMHIADAVGTPMVSLFLPGEVHLFHPYHQPESVVLPRGSHFEAMFGHSNISPILAQTAAPLGAHMNEITVEQVIAAVDDRLKNIACADCMDEIGWAGYPQTMQATAP